MNKFLERLQFTEDTSHFRYPDTFDDSVGVLSVQVDDKGPCEVGTSEFQNDYTIRATLGVHFRANRAQYHEAKRVALVRLQRELYGDLIPLSEELKAYIFAGDRAGCFKTLSKMDEILLGELP